MKGKRGRVEVSYEFGDCPSLLILQPPREEKTATKMLTEGEKPTLFLLHFLRESCLLSMYEGLGDFTTIFPGP